MIRTIAIALGLVCSLWTQAQGPMEGSMEEPMEEPRAVFGLWADVQYADRAENAYRDYRGSKERLAQAIRWLNDQRVPFTVSLGDWVDRDLRSYDSLAPLLAQADSTVYPVLGNHEGYDLRVDSLAAVEKLRAIGFGDSYYYAIDWGAVRLLVLNTNKNAMTDLQLGWIERQLEEAENQRKLVVVLSHHPLVYRHLGQVLADRSKAVCALLERHKNSVKACFAGHFHYGGYHHQAGIHHYVVQGMVEKQTMEICLKITIFGDRMVVEGAKGTRQMLKFSNLYK